MQGVDFGRCGPLQQPTSHSIHRRPGSQQSGTRSDARRIGSPRSLSANHHVEVGRRDGRTLSRSGLTAVAALVSRPWNVQARQVITFGFFEPVNAVKISLPRPQGGIGENDMHAVQQHMLGA